MTLAAGAKLGPYEILAPIGAGGMGEVYRAKDAKLKRDVALKVLPEAFARDPERMARFQREAVSNSSACSGRSRALTTSSPCDVATSTDASRTTAIGAGQ